MKRSYVFCFFWFSFLFGFSQSQTITLTFIGENATTHNIVPLESVLVQNTTIGYDTTIYGATPSLVLTIPLGISEETLSTSEPLSLCSLFQIYLVEKPMSRFV
jgi:hypothetical protein